MAKTKRAASDTLSVTMDCHTSTWFESFSNKLLVDIFEYLNACDLCQAFYGLNDRINTLLQKAQLHILHHASEKDETIWNILVSLSIAIYTGSGGGEESELRPGSYRLRDLLNVLNIPFYFDDYGNGQSIGHGCDGTHCWACWNAALIDVLPRMIAILQQQH